MFPILLLYIIIFLILLLVKYSKPTLLNLILLIYKVSNLTQLTLKNFKIPLSPIFGFSLKSNLIKLCLQSNLINSSIPLYEILLQNKERWVKCLKFAWNKYPIPSSPISFKSKINIFNLFNLACFNNKLLVF